MLHILGAGHAHPETVITNRFLEDLDTGTSEAWIMKHLGIEARRSVLPLDYIRETRNRNPWEAPPVASRTPTAMAVEAARMALERAGIAASEVGLVIGNGCTPLETAPAEAQRVARELDLQVPAFDVFTACPVLALHLDLLASYRPERLPDYVLCVSTAALTMSVDYRDRTDGAIWGDGAAAWVVSPRRGGGFRVLHTSYDADPRRSAAVAIDRFGHFRQDGRAVRHFSVAQTVRMLRALQAAHDLAWDRTYFIGHQANGVMLDSICRNRGIPPERHLTNVIRQGNQAGAGAPATLSESWERVAEGEQVAIAVVGAGLSWGATLLERVG